MFLMRLLLMVSILIFTGCRVFERPAAIAGLTEVVQPQAEAATPVAAVDSSNDTVAKRFNESNESTPSAVENALMWSKRYDTLSKTVMELREKNSALVIENSQLKQLAFKAAADLDQAKKELGEANEFMAQMHTELAKWKKDVLGFRGEMRDAQATQLKALSRIMKSLGAEPLEMEENKENTNE